MRKDSDLRSAMENGVAGSQTSVTFERVWQLHSTGSRRLVRSTRKAWISASIAAMIIFCFLLSPAVRASISSFIESKMIKNSANAIVYEGWVSSVKWDTVTNYATLQDAEQAVGTKLPFPQQFLDLEAGAINRELGLTTVKGNVAGYYYSLRTNERMLSVTANYRSETDPRFNVESTANVIDKTVEVDGVPTHLINVKEFNGFWIYMKKGDWKIVIQGIAQGVEGVNSSVPSFTEEEAIRIARSITW